MYKISFQIAKSPKYQWTYFGVFELSKGVYDF